MSSNDSMPFNSIKFNLLICHTVINIIRVLKSWEAQTETTWLITWLKKVRYKYNTI